MRKNRDEILKYVNNELKDYEGYIQLMGKKIDTNHVFFGSETAPNLDEKDLIYEAHFFSESKNQSVSIRQINDGWLVDVVDLSKATIGESDIKTFYPKFGDFKIKMVQIWKDKPDELCEGLLVSKLQKVVFAGFVKDEKDKK